MISEAPVRKKHLLIVEDSPDLQLLLAQWLRRHEYRITKAMNGREALDVLRSSDEQPCAILLDLMMPIMDGFGFRAEQLKDPRLAGIPVIMMTADSRPAEKAHDLQVKNFLQKPIDVSRLLELTDQVCC